MNTKMIRVKSLNTNEVREFSNLYEAAVTLAGQKYEKTESDYIKRLARFKWVVVEDSTPAPVQEDVMVQIQRLFSSIGSVNQQDVRKMVFEYIEPITEELNCVDKRQRAFEFMTEQALNTMKEKLAERKIEEIVIRQADREDVVVKGQHKQFGTLLRVISARCNALLIGPAGSGKTSAAEKVAETLGLKYYSMSVGAQTGKHEFFGHTTADGKYVRTMFREAYENGGVFLIDEMDAGNANVIVSINQALANGECGFGDQQMVKKHEDFVVIASANTWGSGASREYVGRNQLDASTKDRFVPILWQYDADLEESLCPNKEWLAEVRRVRAIVEAKGIRQVISPRASINGHRLILAGLSFEEVRKMILFKDMNDSELQLVK